MYNMQHHTCSSLFALLSLPRCTSLKEVFLLLYSQIFTSFIPGLSDKIKQRCINQAFCCFYAKSSWVFCFKGPDSKPELSFRLLTSLGM